ncbi:MAG: glutathione peroxidase [Firmicutes bacterium]|jgi:glutathione peroxidase|nr:glutathione peroxidase [Bacillota bacterium]
MKIYEFGFKDTFQEEVKLSNFKGKVMIIANTASKCGFTPQYEGLQELYEKYNDKGLEIIGFPCNQFLDQEPGDEKEIQSFCKLNYGVSFPLSEKVEVRGENKDPLFAYLVGEKGFEGFDTNTEGGAKMQGFLNENLPHLLEGDDIKWNFTKFLVDRDGNVVKRYESPISPEEMVADIEKCL